MDGKSRRKENTKALNNNRRTGQVLRTPGSSQKNVKWGAWGKGFVSIASQSFGGGKGKE